MIILHVKPSLAWSFGHWKFHLELEEQMLQYIKLKKHKLEHNYMEKNEKKLLGCHL